MAIRKSSKLPQTAVLKQILKRCSSLDHGSFSIPEPSERTSKR
ncbi:hypothetical protein CCACVL1_16739 [Corchorus capsularis]|uniref:Uncharacterized protein n=1 Tax=Corchorus capsularis TaxID=210143 RepID=A0A1R3HVX2_COCAP|nr:hypothetical protein CCACVL1_16739 [Corchorus capsularis]